MRVFLGMLVLILLMSSLLGQAQEGTATVVPEATLNVELRPIKSVAWSPDGNFLAVGFGLYIAYEHDYAVQIIDFTTGELVIKLDAQSGDIPSLDWSPDGSNLVSSGGGDGVGKVWDVLTGQLISISHPTSIKQLVDIWSPDGSQIASLSEANLGINIWNSENGQSLFFISTREFGFPISVDWSPDGNKLVTAHVKGTEIIWDATTGTKILELEEHENGVNSIGWSPNGNYIAGGSWDNTVRIWDATTGTELHVLEQHEDIIWKVRWSPDSHYLASASHDGTVRVWNAETGEELAVYDYDGAVYSMDWSPDGAYLAFGGAGSDGQDAELEIVPFMAEE